MLIYMQLATLNNLALEIKNREPAETQYYIPKAACVEAASSRVQIIGLHYCSDITVHNPHLKIIT